VLDPQSAQDTHPLLASAHNGITLDIRPDGTCEGSIAGEPRTGKWKPVEKDGRTVGVEVTFGGSGPYGRATTAMGADGMQVTFTDGGGTFNMMRGGGAGGGGGGGAGNAAARPAPLAHALIPQPVRAGSDGNSSGGANYSLIENNLYMGGLVASPPPGTKATLNLCQNQDTYTTPVYLWVPINDGPPAPSIAWLEQMVAWVSQHRGGETTYVHCLGGVSRSGLVTTAYIMFEHHWGRDQALGFVKSKRPQCNPNSAFLQLLSQYEQVLLGSGSGSGAGSPP
jgi:hypothetical protein